MAASRRDRPRQSSDDQTQQDEHMSTSQGRHAGDPEELSEFEMEDEPLTEHGKRQRKWKGQGKAFDRNPIIVQGETNGIPNVSVELIQKRPSDLPEDRVSFRIDAADWAKLSEINKWFGVVRDGRGKYPFVGSGRICYAGVTKQSKSSSPLAIVGRLIFDAKPGQQVLLMSENYLDLRRDNLFFVADKEEKAEFLASVHAWHVHLYGDQ